MPKFLMLFIFVVVCALPDRGVAAITTIQALSFGNFIVADNNSVQTITVFTGGSYTSSSGLIEITPTVRPGIYDIDGLPPNSMIASVTITPLTTMRGINPINEFVLSAFTTSYTNVDAFGVARITIGGTASTTGNGLGYPDQTYTASVQIDVNF